ncbi:MAG: hypothetical protein ACRDFB_04925 [Rhabdochlamydiaceae bacterium]
MENVNNDIVNGYKKLTSNYNDIDNVNKYSKGKNVDLIANRVTEKLGATAESRAFLCKAAWKLSEARIFNNVELAQRGRNPMGLFIYLCKRDGV